MDVSGCCPINNDFDRSDKDYIFIRDKIDSLSPPVAFVSFQESPSPIMYTTITPNPLPPTQNVKTYQNEAIRKNTIPQEKFLSERRNKLKSKWRTIFPNLEALSHIRNQNKSTDATASPSESSECESRGSEYDLGKGNPTNNGVNFDGSLSPPEHQYESFHSILHAKKEDPQNSIIMENNSYQNSTSSSYKPNSCDVSVLSSYSKINPNANVEGDGGENHFTDNIDSDSTPYFQSLILGIAFLAVWTPQNLLAPNLTQIANFFHFDAKQRDALLGAQIAFATGVLSLPVSSSIGFLADVVKSRRDLYALTVFVGGLAVFCCGLSETYAELYFARFVSGGCMAGCTPIAFSMLGDLFETEDRNMASSALTAMMGVGIIGGQVIAGMIGPWINWRLPFHLSAIACWVSAIAVVAFVEEPVRGGKEEMLREMIRRGKAYDRKLTFDGFVHAMRHNSSNIILMFQGFFSSVPWGVIFVFLNDYLSQEQGLSVKGATFLVFIFGLGCAIGGLLGGMGGQYFSNLNLSFLPIFMGVTTFLGIVPFLGLLDVKLHHTGYLAMFLSLMGGLVASLPSVNVRPCLINVNPPEVRGAALTAANSIINLARGIGPSFLTWICSAFNVNRQYSFNFLLIFFWTITSLQLFWLAETLPQDKSKMEHELAQYARALVGQNNNNHTEDDIIENGVFNKNYDMDDESGIVSIEDRMQSFDANAIRESLIFMSDTLKEMTRKRTSSYEKNDALENNKEKSKLINNSGQAQEQVMEVRSKAEKTLMWRKNEEDREKNKTMYGSVIDDTYYETNYLLNNHTESDDNAECKKLDMVRHRSISASEVETRL